MSTYRITKMPFYYSIYSRERFKISRKIKGLENLLIARLLMKVNTYKEIIHIKRNILMVIISEGINRQLKIAASLLSYKILDLRRVSFGKDHLEILKKVIEIFRINHLLRI